MRIEVDGLWFDFPNDWQAIKWDDSSFYKDVFMKVHDGVKAVDIIAVKGATNVLSVMLEVKDYRHPKAVGPLPSQLALDVAKKVTSTIAGAAVAARKAGLHERALAERLLASQKIEVILHCEDRQVPIVDPSELAIQLRNRLRGVVDRVTVGTAEVPGGDWVVTP